MLLRLITLPRRSARPEKPAADAGEQQKAPSTMRGEGAFSRGTRVSVRYPVLRLGVTTLGIPAGGQSSFVDDVGEGRLVDIRQVV